MSDGIDQANKASKEIRAAAAASPGHKASQETDGGEQKRMKQEIAEWADPEPSATSTDGLTQDEGSMREPCSPGINRARTATQKWWEEGGKTNFDNSEYYEEGYSCDKGASSQSKGDISYSQGGNSSYTQEER